MAIYRPFTPLPDSTLAKWVMTGTAIIGFAFFLIGAWLEDHNRGGIAGAALTIIGGVLFFGVVPLVGLFMDDLVSSRAVRARFPGVAQEEQAPQTVGPGSVTVSDPTLLRVMEKMERRMARLTWMTCGIGIMAAVMIAIFAAQLGRLSH